MARRVKSNSINVDFTGVNLSGGSGFHIPEGEYPMKVKSCEEGVSKNDNNQLEWQFVGTGSKAKGKTFYFYTTLTPESLWKLGQTLVALGYDVPDSPLDIDLDELIDRECIGVVIDDEYQGKTRSKLQEIMSADEGTEAKSAKKGKNGKVKLDEGEVKAMAEDELSDLIDKHDLDVDLREHKTLRRKAAAVIEALGEKELIA